MPRPFDPGSRWKSYQLLTISCQPTLRPRRRRGRGRGVGVDLGAAVAVGVAVAVAVGVGEGDAQGLTGQLKISIEAIIVTPSSA